MPQTPLQFDDFLDTPTWDALKAYFKNNASFRYGWGSNLEVTEFTHWHIDYLFNSGADQKNHEQTLYANPNYKLIADVWNKLKEFHLKGHSLVRCYANAHTYGVEGAPHTDSPIDGNFTTILYVVPEWKTEWAGETAFFNAEGDVVAAVMHRSELLEPGIQPAFKRGKHLQRFSLIENLVIQPLKTGNAHRSGLDRR